MDKYFCEMKTELTVRYAETDPMKIAHHSNYPVWFEISRTDFFKKIGFPYSKIEAMGILLPLTDMRCIFKKSAKYEDVIVIQTQISILTHARIGFHYEVYNKETKMFLASGETKHGWTDSYLKPIAIGRVLPDLFSELQKYYKTLKTDILC